jgi:hypothetical protein
MQHGSFWKVSNRIGDKVFACAGPGQKHLTIDNMLKLYAFSPEGST